MRSSYALACLPVVLMACGNSGGGEAHVRDCPDGASRCALSIAAGPVDTCAVLNDGTMECWGDNSLGQLGDGTESNRSSPTAVLGVAGVSRLALAQWHTCALSAGGAMCWGSNLSGALGFTSPDLVVPTPQAASRATGLIDIAAGMSSTWGVGANGAVTGWGQFARGPDQGDVAIGAVKQLAVSETHACALLGDATVRCWGDNASGDLGDGTTTPHPEAPVAVFGLSGVTQVAVGRTDSCAVSSGGNLACWGATADGRQHLTPAPVADVQRVRQVALGSGFTCALIFAGTITCWGVNGQGQLGRGTITAREEPGPVAGLAGISSIVAGANHVCALTSGGSVACWGDGSLGQVGNAVMRGSLAPAEVQL